jgi:hypothetical protein
VTVRTPRLEPGRDRRRFAPYTNGMSPLDQHAVVRPGSPRFGEAGHTGSENPWTSLCVSIVGTFRNLLRWSSKVDALRGVGTGVALPFSFRPDKRAERGHGTRSAFVLAVVRTWGISIFLLEGVVMAFFEDIIDRIYSEIDEYEPSAETGEQSAEAGEAGKGASPVRYVPFCCVAPRPVTEARSRIPDAAA